MNFERSAILVTVRLKSQRLPRKVLKPLCGQPMLWHLIERLKLAAPSEQIVICTSTVAQDDELAELAERWGLPLFRGHPDDVLQRLTDAATELHCDDVIICTADNPFVDPEYAKRLLAFHRQHHHDYSRIEGLPLGAFCYALRRQAMVKACAMKDALDTEIWGGYFSESGAFSCGVLQVSEQSHRWPELRLTVDTPADFALVEQIFAALYRPGEVFSLDQIIALCRQRPELVAINAKVVQRGAPPIALKDKR